MKVDGTVYIIPWYLKSFLFSREYFNLLPGEINYSQILPSLAKSKSMYAMLLRPDEHFINIEDFVLEIEAAKVNKDIITYILKEGRQWIDFFDYLTFFPLFLHTHDVIMRDVIRTSNH